MLAIVYSFMQLEYVDDRLINTMEKVIKLKGCQVKCSQCCCFFSSRRSFSILFNIRKSRILDMF